jgi:DNA processing protein
MEQAKYYNALNNLFGGDYLKLKRVWERFNDWKKAWNYEKNADINVEEEWQKLKKQKISLILKEDAEYPELLKEIPAPPFGIYVLGSIRYAQPAIAIVGTRAAAPQGKELAKKFARQLSDLGFAVISGLAMGIDECAHRGALEGKGNTIAVLGTPLNHIYPRQNEKLALGIIEKGGAIISEFPFAQEYHRQNFIIRNRIISGLANATLVIEAPEKSGALATARFAVEQNRDLFVIPGSVGMKNYHGSNELIKAGAIMTTEIKDILVHFGIELCGAGNNSLVGENEKTGSENMIIVALKNKGGQLTAEELLKLTAMEVGELNRNLAMLVIKGIIKELNGKYSL